MRKAFFPCPTGRNSSMRVFSADISFDDREKCGNLSFEFRLSYGMLSSAFKPTSPSQIGDCWGVVMGAWKQPPTAHMYVLSWEKVQDCFWLESKWIILTIELGFAVLVLGLFWEKLPSSFIDRHLLVISHVQCCAKGPIRWPHAHIWILKMPICVANLCACPSQVL